MAHDALSDLLDGLQFRSVVAGILNLHAPWGIALPELPEGLPQDIPHPPASVRLGGLHLVLSGGGWIDLDGGRATEFRAGDLLVLPAHRPHRLRDAPGTPTRPIWEVAPLPPRNQALSIYRRAEAPNTTCILTCGLFFRTPANRLLDAELPALIHLSGRDPDVARWLSPMMALLELGCADTDAGAEALRNRLGGILYVQAVRHYLDRCPTAHSWMADEHDEEVARALELLNENPSEPWTVAKLADRVALSRSVFAERFTRQVGVPPLRYLTDLRMRRAAELLSSTRSGLKEVALAVGYGSWASFGTAFKRFHRVSPGAFRRSVRAEGSADAPLGYAVG